MVQETRVQSQVESYQRLKKMVLDATLLNTQHYKVRIKGKVEQSRKRSSALPYTSTMLCTIVKCYVQCDTRSAGNEHPCPRETEQIIHFVRKAKDLSEHFFFLYLDDAQVTERQVSNGHVKSVASKEVNLI